MSQQLKYSHHLLVVLVVMVGGRNADLWKRRGWNDNGDGKTTCRYLNNGQPKAPDVRLHCILVTKQALGLHQS